MNIIKEQWKPVEGFEGLYEISNLGRVKSLKYGKEKILKPFKIKKGYLLVHLCRNGKSKYFYVHRLVASAFIPNPEGLPEVNHKDEDKVNNVVGNLEFCSRRYNINYGTHNERMVAALTNRQDKSKVVEATRFSDFREICLNLLQLWKQGEMGILQALFLNAVDGVILWKEIINIRISIGALQVNHCSCNY